MAKIAAELVRDAADLLGIRDQASLPEIRALYHDRVREWHPDVSRKDPVESHEMTIRLREAYELLVEYCMNHPFSFRAEDLARELADAPADYWMERFGDDPIWG